MTLLKLFGVQKKRTAPEGVTRGNSDSTKTDWTGAKKGPLLNVHTNPYNHNASQTLAVKILIIALGASMILNVMQTLAMTEIYPLHTVVPYLVTFSDRANQMVQIEPTTVSISTMTIIARDEVKQYIESRYTVDASVAQTVNQWNLHVRIFSTGRVYNNFLTETKGILQKIKDVHMTRQVSIQNILQTGPGIYQITFSTYTHKNSTGLATGSYKTHHYIATLKVFMSPQKVPKSLINLNPFGFVVVGYTVTKQESAADSIQNDIP